MGGLRPARTRLSLVRHTSATPLDGGRSFASEVREHEHAIDFAQPAGNASGGGQREQQETQLGLALLVLLILLLDSLLFQSELGFLFGISVALLLFVGHFDSDPGERLMLSSKTKKCSVLTFPTGGHQRKAA